MQLTTYSKRINRKETFPKINDSRRLKIEKIRQREEVKGDRRNILHKVLETKLIKKYGQNDPTFISAIKIMVAKLIKSSNRLCESDISALEGLIKKKACDRLRINVKSASSYNDCSQNTSRLSSINTLQTTSSRNDEITSSQRCSRNKLDKLPIKDEWVLINALRVAEHDTSISTELEKKKKEKGQQRKWLDSQLEERRKRILVEKEEEMELYKQQVKDLKKWQIEEEEKQKKVKEEIEFIKNERDSQLLATQNKINQEQQKRRQKDSEEVLRCQLELKRLEEEAVQKRIAEHERMKALIIENKKVEEEKLKHRQIEQSHDIKLMDDYAKKLAKEEQDRIYALESKIRRQDEIHQGIAMSTHELIRQKALEDEKRAEEYQKKKEEMDRQRDIDQIEERKKNALERKKFLAYQQQLKKETKEKEEKEELEYALKFRREGEKAKEQEKLVHQSLRYKSIKYQEYLKEQMKDQKQKKIEFDRMNEREKKLNSQILEKLHDEELLKKVQEKLSGEKKFFVEQQSKRIF